MMFYLIISSLIYLFNLHCSIYLYFSNKFTQKVFCGPWNLYLFHFLYISGIHLKISSNIKFSSIEIYIKIYKY